MTTNRASRAAIFVLAMLSVALAGCDRLTYTYKGTEYDSAGEALEAQRRDDEALIAAIERREHAVAPTVRILIPSQDRLYALTYVPRCVFYLCLSSFEVHRARSYDATTWHSNLMSIVGSIQRSHLFESSEVEEYDEIDPSVIAASGNLVLAVHEAELGHTKRGWFLYIRGDPEGTYLPFHESISPRDRRVNAWLDALEAVVRQKLSASGSREP